jgi:hypothetical protein
MDNNDAFMVSIICANAWFTSDRRGAIFTGSVWFFDGHRCKDLTAAMIRARFKVNPEDFRPVVWPIKHPYWCTGYTDTNAILVAYADDMEEISRNWPDAEDIEFETVSEYTFTNRFPSPKWFVNNEVDI